MVKAVDQVALDRLIKQCEETMTKLQTALEQHNIKTAKANLSCAETLRDVLESKMPPQHRQKGATFLEVKSRLDEAIVKGSFELNALDGFSDKDYSNHNSRSAYGMFGDIGGAAAGLYEDNHSSQDDIDFSRYDFN